jgi:hypothetical protein
MRVFIPALLLIVSLACSGGPTPDAAPEQEAPAAAPEAASPTAAAEAVVRDLYAPYLNGSAGSLENSGKLSEAFTTAWVGANAAMHVRGQDMGPVDFDPLVAGQDFSVSKLEISGSAAGDAVTVTARFDNFTTPTEVRFRMVPEGGAWKIDNVTHDNADDTMDWDLRALLAAAAK